MIPTNTELNVKEYKVHEIFCSEESIWAERKILKPNTSFKLRWDRIREIEQFNQSSKLGTGNFACNKF